MKNKLRMLFTEKAEREINDIIDYIAINLSNPKAAHDLYKEFENIIETISSFPLSCPVSELPFYCELRKAYFGNYILFYEFINDTITVISILYATRNYRDLL